MKDAVKIRKNLTDQEMLAGFQEKPTFETAVLAEEPAAPKISKSKDEPPSYFTKELREEVNRALLELKVKLYKEGIVDYNLKVSQANRQVLITAAPIIKKEK